VAVRMATMDLLAKNLRNERIKSTLHDYTS